MHVSVKMYKIENFKIRIIESFKKFITKEGF